MNILLVSIYSLLPSCSFSLKSPRPNHRYNHLACLSCPVRCFIATPLRLRVLCIFWFFLVFRDLDTPPTNGWMPSWKWLDQRQAQVRKATNPPILPRQLLTIQASKNRIRGGRWSVSDWGTVSRDKNSVCVTNWALGPQYLVFTSFKTSQKRFRHI